MNQQKDIHTIQHMLEVLLEVPDPDFMLKHSKPIYRDDGFVKIVEKGQEQKFKWHGALPGNIRDERLQLNYDKEMNKFRNNTQTQSFSKQLNNQIHKQGQNTFRNTHKSQTLNNSVECHPKDLINSARNYNGNCGIHEENQNYSVTYRSNNYFENSPTPNFTQNRRFISHSQHSNKILQHHLRQSRDSPIYKNYKINNEQDDQQLSDSKQLSIKYIGEIFLPRIHNNVFGVLSRRIPLSQQIDKISKCKQIQQERRVQSGFGSRKKSLQHDRDNSIEYKNSSLFLEQKPFSQILEQNSQILDSDALFFDQNQLLKESVLIEQNEKKIPAKNNNGILHKQIKKQDDLHEDKLTINKKNNEEDIYPTQENYLASMTNQSRKQLINYNKKILKIDQKAESKDKQNKFYSHKQSLQDQQKIKLQHQNALRQVLEDQQNISQNKVSTNNDLRINQLNQQDDNRKGCSQQTVQTKTQYYKFYGSPIPKSENQEQKTINQNSRPGTTIQSRTYLSCMGQQKPQSQNCQRVNQKNKNKNFIPYQQLQKQNHNYQDNVFIENSYFFVNKRNSNHNIQQNGDNQTYEVVPEPQKYDKSLVTKYSLERKLTPIKKLRQKSPDKFKNQFYVIWNNQYINSINLK